MPAAPIAMSVCPIRQARPAVSLTIDPQAYAGELLETGAQVARGTVGIARQRDDGPGLEVGGVDARGGEGQPGVRADDAGLPAPRHDAVGLGLEQ